MEKEIIMVIGICLLSLTSAATIYSGGIYYTDLTNEIQNLQTVECEIINNQSNLEGLNFTFNNTGYTIALEVNYKPDNFTVSCLLNGYKIVEESRNSGGSCIPKKDFDWNCSEWGECINETQTRDCKKYNNCGNDYGQPNLMQECFTIDSNITEINKTNIVELTNNEPIKNISFFTKLINMTNKVIDFLIFWK